MKSLTKLKRHTPQGDGGYAVSLAFAAFAEDVTPRKGRRQLPRFAAHFRAVKRGSCFFVKFRVAPDIFPDYFQLRGIPQAFYKIRAFSVDESSIKCAEISLFPALFFA